MMKYLLVDEKYIINFIVLKEKFGDDYNEDGLYNLADTFYSLYKYVDIADPSDVSNTEDKLRIGIYFDCTEQFLLILKGIKKLNRKGVNSPLFSSTSTGNRCELYCKKCKDEGNIRTINFGSKEKRINYYKYVAENPIIYLDCREHTEVPDISVRPVNEYARYALIELLKGENIPLYSYEVMYTNYATYKEGKVVSTIDNTSGAYAVELDDSNAEFADEGIILRENNWNLDWECRDRGKFTIYKLTFKASDSHYCTRYVFYFLIEGIYSPSKIKKLGLGDIIRIGYVGCNPTFRKVIFKVRRVNETLEEYSTPTSYSQHMIQRIREQPMEIPNSLNCMNTLSRINTSVELVSESIGDYLVNETIFGGYIN